MVAGVEVPVGAFRNAVQRCDEVEYAELGAAPGH